MRINVHNLRELISGVNDADLGDVLVLVLFTAGNQAYRFIVNQHGLERQECTREGEAQR